MSYMKSRYGYLPCTRGAQVLLSRCVVLGIMTERRKCCCFFFLFFLTVASSLFGEAGTESAIPICLPLSLLKWMDGAFGSIKFLLRGEEGKQPGCRAHSSKLTLLVRRGRNSKEAFTKGYGDDRERRNSLQGTKETRAVVKNCTVCCYCP